MDRRIVGFEWDDGNQVKFQRHGMTLDDVESVFRLSPLVGPDPAHSIDEERQRAVGLTNTGRIGFVVFTIRTRAEGLFIRPISARYMHAKERQAYDRHRRGEKLPETPHG